MSVLALPGSGKTESFITYLSGAVRPEALGQRRDFGVLFNPLMGNRPEGLGVFACDNGVWSEYQAQLKGKSKPFSLERFLKLLDRWDGHKDQALFAAAPDVVGDWRASIERSLPVLQEIRRRGYPAAFVAQNDLEYHLAKVPWAAFDVLFLGGAPDPSLCSKQNRMGEWKLSRGARRLTDLAHAKGKRVHMGRVNSHHRLRIAADWGCQSADGTCIARHPQGPTVATAEVQSWLDRINTREEYAA